MSLCFLKYSCSLYMLEWAWREPCQTFCMYEVCFGRCKYEDRKDTEVLAQIRGEQVTQLNSMPELNLPADSGEYGGFGRLGHLSCSQESKL